MTPTPDYSTWLTKQEAAAAMGVTTKTVERFVQAGQIQQARWQRDGRGPLLAVYHPTDVDRMAATRRQGPPAPFLVTTPDVPTNGNGHRALARVPAAADAGIQNIPGDDLLRALVLGARRVLSETSETSTLYLTVDEAAAVLNWTPRDLRRAIRDGDVPCRFGERRNWRRWRIRRKDLEAL